MKIEQEEVFKPIIITLQSEDEARVFYAIMVGAADPSDSLLYGTIKRHRFARLFVDNYVLSRW